MSKINILKLFIAIFICQMAGFIGAIFTTSSIPTWYATLNKPFFSPPNSVFGPVWTALFTLMGIALYIVWQKKTKLKKIHALQIFTIQLILNTLWSILFFGFQSPALAFIEILFLWAFIALSIKTFYKISKTAGYLLVPYILWVSFATLLNLSIVLLN